jgi:prepilin-type N-terminal cleavage/methylation domain-containing protein
MAIAQSPVAARPQPTRGFTIIELLAVVAIMGLLAAIVIPRFLHTKDGALVASMQSDLRNLVTAEENFFAAHQTYANGVGPTESAAAAAFTPSGSNLLTLSTVGASGWAAEVANSALKGSITRCGLYFGTGSPPNPAVVTPGVPACY